MYKGRRVYNKRSGIQVWVLFLFVVLWGMPLGGMAQQGEERLLPKQIKGKVLYEEEKTPIEHVTVQLLTRKDSTVVVSAATDKGGDFVLPEVKPNDYILSLSFISFESAFVAVDRKDFAKKEIVLPPVELKEMSILLSEAVVVGQMPELIVKEDTLEYNPAAFQLEESAVIEDLLKRLPGVEVDADGRITAGGKVVSRVTVDGENFFGNDPKMTTKNLEIGIVEKLQVIEKKSDLEELTGIDDGERETIINLTIKEDKKRGWISNIDLGVGSLVKDVSADGFRYMSRSMVNRFYGDDKYSLIVNANNNSARGQGVSSMEMVGLNMINVISKQLKVTGDISFNNNGGYVERSSFRQNILEDSVSYRRSESESKNRGSGLSGSYRLEYKPTEKTTLLFTPNVNMGWSHANDSSFTSTMAGDEERTEVNRSNRKGRNNSRNLSVSSGLILSHEFAKKGRRATLNLNGNYGKSKSNGENISENLFFLMPERNSLLNQESQTDNISYSYSFNASYVEPIKESNFLQFSYTYRGNHTENIRNTYDYDPLTEDFSNLNVDYSKSLTNHTDHQTVSMSYRSVKEKFDYRAGLNVEPSYIKSISFVKDGIVEGVDSIVHDPGGRNVVNYAPNAFLTYRFTKEQNLRFIYRGRTSQPSVSQLDPTEDVTNPLHIRSGNADLLPSFSNNLSLTYNFSQREKQQSVRATLNYSFVMNQIINKTIYEAGTGVQKTYPINQNGNWNSSAGLLFNLPLDKKKRLNLSSNFEASFRNQIGYMSFKEDVDTKNVAQTLSLRENLGLSYRRDWLYLQLRGVVRYSSTHNSLESRGFQEDVNYSASLTGQVNLPKEWVVSTSTRYTGQTGLSSGYNRNEVIWDVDVSKKLFKSKRGMVKLQWTDLLQQRTSIRRNVTSSYIEDSESNVLTGYVLVSFSYRFNSMGGAGGGNNRGGGRRGVARGL